MNLTAGTALNYGKYVLNTRLGKGALSVTYQAIDTQSGQTVVLRTLSESLRRHSDFEQFKQQFLELAERLKTCKHSNLVQVLDSFEEAGYPYLVMEYVPGQTLAEFIQTNALSQAKAINYVRQIGNALSAIHKAGLLHRDVKPHNIIRRQNTDNIVLTEFGIASEFSAGMMQTQANLFSAGYAPLEQYVFEAKRTPATDIYGLAATLYCLLYKNPPLPAPVRQTLSGDKDAHLFSPESVQITPQISPAVKQALGRGLEITPRKRPQSVEAWLSLLPKPEKPQTPQPSLQECLVAQFKTGKKASPRPKSIKNKVKSGAINSTTSPSQTPQNNPISQPSTIRRVVKQAQSQDPSRDMTSTPIKIQTGSLLQALLMTGAIAASAGLGFGFALRLNGPQVPGSTFFHTEQSFPPRSNWPGSERRL
ncbi:MAG: serine/threonine-protein kinase [Cyanobacteriota bacterium]